MTENDEQQDVIFSIPAAAGDDEGEDEICIPVIETNADHEITSCNPAALSFFDLESDKMLGSRFEQIVLVSDCINDDCIFRQAVEKAQPGSTKAVVKTREKEIPVHYAVIPVVNQEKNVNAVMHYFFERSDETMLAEEVSYVANAFISGDFSVRASTEHFSSEEKKVLTSLNTLIE